MTEAKRIGKYEIVEEIDRGGFRGRLCTPRIQRSPSEAMRMRKLDILVE